MGLFHLFEPFNVLPYFQLALKVFVAVIVTPVVFYSVVQVFMASHPLYLAIQALAGAAILSNQAQFSPMKSDQDGEI